jgi:hypothetical protein
MHGTETDFGHLELSETHLLRITTRRYHTSLKLAGVKKKEQLATCGRKELHLFLQMFE